MTRNLFLSAALATMMSTAAFAGDAVPLPLPDLPTPAPASPPSYVVPTPGPNGGFTVHGADGGYSGSVTHQPNGHGYETNSGTITTPSGNSYGGSVTTGPNGPVSGVATFETTY